MHKEEDSSRCCYDDNGGGNYDKAAVNTETPTGATTITNTTIAAQRAPRAPTHVLTSQASVRFEELRQRVITKERALLIAKSADNDERQATMGGSPRPNDDSGDIQLPTLASPTAPRAQRHDLGGTSSEPPPADPVTLRTQLLPGHQGIWKLPRWRGYRGSGLPERWHNRLGYFTR